MRASRDERIRELDRQGWSLRAIAAEVHLSHVAVRKVLVRQRSARTVDLRAVDAREAEIVAEIGALYTDIAAKNARLVKLRRELAVIAEERLSAGVDQILGL